MTYARRSVDLSGYPDLVVVYFGYRAKSLKGAQPASHRPQPALDQEGSA